MPEEKYLFEELDALAQKVKKTRALPEDLHDKIDRMLDRLNRIAKIGGYAAEFDTMSRYIEVLTTIPWEQKTEDKLDLVRTKQVLDKNHFGLEDVKERILEYLATMILMKRQGESALAKTPVLLFVGLQGIGKTTIAMSIAEALERKFVRIALGAIGTVLELRGRSKVFPEAEPGQIIKALIRTGVKNPVILLDEIDKASGEKGLREDVMAMDRMEVIKMPSYTDAEKIVIGRDYLLPKVLVNAGLKEGELSFDPNLWQSIVRPFGFDSGIRSLNRTLESIARKAAKEIVDGKSAKVYITAENLKYYLPK
ncbi:MAG: Lon protease [candidate division WWE3 bacterium GW2011_GWA2_46_9]|uniref:Lon protease n=1 Tax=candidate division WWE3 bacterium GW2011_GWA2_46_9 TaxID=1619111 RepID=A0A0G1QTH9_UNCKA|nr:MAG: Lon protease [candidate division WWE3 bacterium GW2011_GWA2_46_9]